MLPLRYAHRWRVVGVVLLAVAFVVAMMPAMWPQGSVRDILTPDKWLHGIAFTLLAVWFSGQYSRRSYWRVAVGLLVFGAAIELGQYMTTYRSSEWFDLYADAAGIAVGFSIALLGPGGWSLRLERWLLARRD